MQDRSEIEQHLFGLLNTLFDLAQEKDSLSSVNDSVIVGKSHIHNRSRQDLATYNNRSNFGRVHAKNSRLRHVDDWCTKHGSKDTTIGDGESTALHIFKRDLSLSSTFG